jgi:hypothetical protein
MSWYWQIARSGNYELHVSRFLKWSYRIVWHTETAITTVGIGSEGYDDAYEARYAAVRHLANILPKAQSERLLASQGELIWKPWRDPRKHRSSR